MARLLKRLHPESIPWPGTALYNWVSSSRVFQRHYELVARDIVGYCRDGQLLDIGTGPAWLLLKLYQESPGLRLVGVDSSPSMVGKARQNMAAAGLAEQILIQEGNANQLPFADDGFDIVVSTGSIHHWKAPTAALNEVYRVLKDKGYALMYDLVSDTPASVMREARHEFSRLSATLFWLHSFEEPFYRHEDFAALADPTLFKKGQTRFVGLLCCLILRKGAGDTNSE